MQLNIDKVYYIARKLGRKISYTQAKAIANRFSMVELDKMIKDVAKRSSFNATAIKPVLVKEVLKLEIDALESNLRDPSAPIQNTMNLITLVVQDSKKLIQEVETNERRAA